MKTIIDKTEEQLSKANTPAEKVYLSAFLDGAKAQKEEDKIKFEELSTYIGTLEAEKDNLISTFGECLRAGLREFVDRLKALYTNDETYNRTHPHTSLVRLFANIDKTYIEVVGEKNV